MRSRSRRNWLAGLNSGAAVFLMFLLVIFINMLSMRHYVRMDFSGTGFYALSGKTRALLGELNQPVQVTVFIQPGHESFHLLYEDVLQLLREYEYASKNNVRVERVDPDRHLGRAEYIMRHYALTEPNVVIIDYGTRFKVINAGELAEMDFLPVARGGLPRMVAFNGEQVISSALYELTQTQPPRVYFLQGHGERDFEDHDPYVGLSRIGQRIRRDYIDLAPFDFMKRSTLPEDAEALIIAGPTLDYSAAEIDRLQTFANRTGRLILMLNAETDAGFDSMLRNWGLRSVDNVVVDPSSTLSGFDVLVSSYRDHPITEKLDAMTTFFYWPRGLPLLREDQDTAADKPQATPLLLSSDRSWGETSFEERPYKQDANRDLAGPLPMAVAIERGGAVALKMDIARNRAVVFGDVDFVSNSGLSGANADLFMNALNWVLDRDQMLDISPKPVEETRLIISRQQMRQLFRAVVVGVPLAVAGLGMIVWWRRRA